MKKTFLKLKSSSVVLSHFLRGRPRGGNPSSFVVASTYGYLTSVLSSTRRGGRRRSSSQGYRSIRNVFSSVLSQFLRGRLRRGNRCRPPYLSKVFLAFVFLLSPFFVSAASLTEGLVGYWTFNGSDISGVTAYDKSGLSNNGTLTNSPTKVVGKFGQGLSFNGTNYVNMFDPANGSLDFADSFSMSFWMKSSYVAPGIQAIAGKAFTESPAVGGGYGFTLDAGTNLLGFQVRDSAGGLVESKSVNPLNDGKWHHVVGVRNHTSNTSYFYVDGILNDSDVGAVASYTSNLLFGLGSRYRKTPSIPLDLSGMSVNWAEYNSVEPYRGLLDEVRVYSRMLSSSEVFALYKLGTATVNASQDTKSTNGLVGHWSFDGKEIVGTTAVDSSGLGNNGTLTNGPKKVAGKLGQALDFSGVKYTTQSISNFRSSDNEGAISAWIKGVPGISSIIFSSDNSTSNQSRFIFYTSDANDPKARLRFLTVAGGVGNTVEGSSSVLDNKWHHVVVISNGSVWAMYVDGVSQTVTATTGTNVGNWFSDVAGRDRVTIGAQYNGVTPAYSFRGIIDDVRVYNRALSASEVQSLYKLGNATTAPSNDTGLVGYWPLNSSDLNGTTAFDRSGKGNNGTLVSGPTKVAGKLGQGLNFNGVNSYVDTGDMFYSDSFSICAWVNPTVVDANSKTIVSKRNSSGITKAIANANEWNFFHSTSGLVFNAWKEDTTAALNFSDGVPLSVGKWAFVCVVVRGNGNTTSIYQNGIQTASATQAGIIANTTNPIQIAVRTNNNDTRYFEGSIDDVRIYNRALSASEISRLYKLGTATINSK